MFMDMVRPRSRATATVIGAAGIGYGIWRMAQGQRDWLAWSAATVGAVKMTEALTGWNAVGAARRNIPMDREKWRPLVQRIIPAALKAWM